MSYFTSRSNKQSDSKNTENSENNNVVCLNAFRERRRQRLEQSNQKRRLSDLPDTQNVFSPSFHSQLDKLTNHPEKNSPQQPHVSSHTSESTFRLVMKRNKEVKRKIRENRLRLNSQVLTSYNIKK